MRIVARDGCFSDVVRLVREALPERARDALGIAEGNIPLYAEDIERIIAHMPDPDELCELF